MSDNPSQPLHLTYTLTRRQRWRSHFGLWGIYWKPLLAIHAVVASVVALAWWLSWWFLLILAIPIFPPIDNLWRWVVGIVAPLFGGRRIEAVIDVEAERVGADFRGYGLEYLAYQDIRRIAPAARASAGRSRSPPRSPGELSWPFGFWWDVLKWRSAASAGPPPNRERKRP